ncbi:MAG: ATP-binding protein [Elsteraceae bacterium]
MITEAQRIAALEEALAERDAQIDRLIASAANAENRLRQTLEALPVGVAIIGSDGVVLEASDLYIGLLPGATRENTIGHSILDRVVTVAPGRLDPTTGDDLTEEQRQAWLERRLSQYKDPNLAPDTAEYLTSKGIHLRTTSQRAADGTLVQIAQDVGEIRRDEQRLRRALEMLPAAISFFDADNKLVAYNEHFVEHLRPDLRDRCRIGKMYHEMAWLLLRSVVSFEPGILGAETYADMSDEEVEILAQARTALVRSRTEPVLAEYKMWDGRIFRSRSVLTPEGGVVRVAVDVTAERRLSQNFAEVVASLDDAVFLFDKDLKLALWSPSAAKVLPFLAPLLREGVASDDIGDAMRKAAIEADRFQVTGILTRTYIRRLLDGRTIEVRCLPTREGGLLVVCSDQTDMRRASQLAARADRMESLGRLVAGVAHEINTPLGIAITTASALADETGRIQEKFDASQMKRSDLQGYLGVATEACGLLMRNLRRSGELVASFKRVSVDELSGEHRRFDLANVFEDAAAMLRPQLRTRGLELRIECPPDLTLTSYPAAFTQIVTNFVMNSVIHAYPDGRAGVLELAARKLEGGVEIRYRDDGVGVPPEILGRIFEHFFTTRRGQGGSGLGLGIVHNLVTHQLGGEIEAINPPGRGLEIRVTAPETAAKGMEQQSWE